MLACEIKIARQSGERDRFGGTSEHVGDGTGENLEPVCVEPDFMVNDVLVDRTKCALETVVRLEEDIELCGGFTLVDVDRFRRTLTIP